MNNFSFPARISCHGRFNSIRLIRATVPIIPDETNALIELRWQEELARNPKLHNGSLAALHALNAKCDQLEVRWCESNYREYLGASHPNIPNEHRRLPMSVGLLVRVNYSSYLVATRSPGVDWPLMRHLSAAGGVKAGENPFDVVLREAKEELGLDPHELEPLSCLGVVEDLVRPQYMFVFVADVQISEAELIKRAAAAPSAEENCQLTFLD